jgi:hypothetical protein
MVDWSRRRSVPMNDQMEASAANLAPDVPRISPELALVDPELADRVRGRIPRKQLGHRLPLPVLCLVDGDAPAADATQHPATSSPTASPTLR